MTSPKGPAPKLAAFALGTLVALAIAEGIARLAESHAAAGRDDAASPDADAESRRRRLYPRPREERADFRILVVGDSFTAGPSVTVKEIYSHRLEALLVGRHGPAAFEVLTLAAPGWNTEEEYRRAEPFVAGLSPDLLLLGVCLNDPEPSDPARLRRHHLEAGLPEPGAREEGWAYRASAAVRLALDRLDAWRSRPAVSRYYHSFYDEELASWRAFRRALERFRHVSRKKRAWLVLVIFPIFDSPLDRRYPYRDLHEKIGDTARGLGIRTLDLLAAFEGMDVGTLRLTPRDPHPSALAHRIAAERILEYLEAERLLTGRRPARRAAGAAEAASPP